MSVSKVQKRSPFTLQGQFLGFFTDRKGQLKFLRIAVKNDDLKIKLSKELRDSYNPTLIPGDCIQIWGEIKQKRQADRPQFKAYHVNKIHSISRELQPCLPIQQQVEKPTCQHNAKILVCQKSGCWKRGGRKFSKELETELGDRGLQDHVKIQHTGCLKRCSKAPNIVVIPNKEKIYCNRMESHEVVDLLVKRLACHY